MSQPKDTRGDSTVQREAEIEIRAALESDYGELRSTMWKLSDGTTVEMDAVSKDRRVLIEIFARQGKLLDGQKKKLARDILKLALIKMDVPAAEGMQFIIAHANPFIASHLTNESWLALAAKKLGIKTIDVSARLPNDLKARITQAQTTP